MKFTMDKPEKAMLELIDCDVVLERKSSLLIWNFIKKSKKGVPKHV